MKVKSAHAHVFFSEVYGDTCMGTSGVRRCVKRFKDGKTDIADQKRCVDLWKNGKRSVKIVYVQTRNQLCRVLRKNHPKEETVILQHDNARPHTARLTLNAVQNNGWEMLSHPP
jgi:hypothetical protein